MSFKDLEIPVVIELKKMVDSLTDDERHALNYTDKLFDIKSFQSIPWRSLAELEQNVKDQLEDIPKELEKYRRLKNIKENGPTFMELLNRVSRMNELERAYVYGRLDMKSLHEMNDNDALKSFYFEMGQAYSELIDDVEDVNVKGDSHDNELGIFVDHFLKIVLEVECPEKK